MSRAVAILLLLICCVPMPAGGQAAARHRGPSDRELVARFAIAKQMISVPYPNADISAACVAKTGAADIQFPGVAQYERDCQSVMAVSEGVCRVGDDCSYGCSWTSGGVWHVRIVPWATSSQVLFIASHEALHAYAQCSGFDVDSDGDHNNSALWDMQAF